MFTVKSYYVSEIFALIMNTISDGVEAHKQDYIAGKTTYIHTLHGMGIS